MEELPPDKRLPFWRAMVKRSPRLAEAAGSGQIMELMVRSCIRLRISEELGQKFGRKMDDLFPFLSGSLMASHIASLDQHNCCLEFPKISTKQNPESY